MYRAVIVFNGSLDNEYPFYSTAKDTESEIRDMLTDMERVLAHAVSVQVQEAADQIHRGWHTLPAFNDDWTQRTSSD
jgi:uncharacterized membrane protein